MLPEGDSLNTRLKQVALVLGWMLAVAGGVWALASVWPAVRWVFAAVSPFLTALVVAYLFNPIVQVVQKKFRLGRIMGIVTVLVVIVLIFLIFFGVVLPIVYMQLADVVRDVRSAMPDLLERLASAALTVSEKLGLGSGDAAQQSDLRERLQSIWQSFDLSLNQLMAQISEIDAATMKGLTQGGAKAVAGVLSAVAGFLSSIVGAIVTGIMVLVIAFYYLMDFHAIPGLVRKVLPDEIEDRTMVILHKLDVAVGGFLRGQLIVCCFVAILATAGLALIGMYKYALIVGLFAGAINFIPYLGPSAGATPAVLWALLSRSHETWGERMLYVGLVVGLFALIQTIDGFVFQPRIVGKSSNLHPLAVMLALFVGAQFGISGMILAVPSMCIVRVLVKELWWDKHIARKKGAAEPA